MDTWGHSVIVLDVQQCMSFPVQQLCPFQGVRFRQSLGSYDDSARCGSPSCQQLSNVPKRHMRASVGVMGLAGKLYTMVTGANSDRWDKVKDKLELVARSFIVSTKY